MNAKIFREELIESLSATYGLPESEAIARVVLEHLARHDAPAFNADPVWPADLQEKATDILKNLSAGRPLQYVLQESWFNDSLFFVDESVLIPRPETEELFDWIRKDHLNTPPPNRILDIGTGSGILSVSLKRLYPNATVMAIDISEAAIHTAQKNAVQQGAELALKQMDFTKPDERAALPGFDLIVSNPPYIALEEKASMAPHVLEHEPWQALFVPNSDPLCFYRAIAAFGSDHLSTEGSIYVELHEERASETSALFESMGYETVIRRDMQDKERMLRARKRS